MQTPITLFMLFDVESIGLHGEGFAVGYVVIDAQGTELEATRITCPPDTAQGDDEGRMWVKDNCPAFAPDFIDPTGVRACFWGAWLRWKAHGAVLVADCAWPVEARFLAACVDDDRAARSWEGPYPLHDIATARLVAGLDPLETTYRLAQELPEHDPLADARQSARLWREATR